MSYKQETRILKPSSSLTSSYALVTMPKTAWYWLDDLVKTKFPRGGYKAFMREFGRGVVSLEALSQTLKTKAQEHCDARMADFYNLANDNTSVKGSINLQKNPALPRQNADISQRMPTCYRLFHFMPHATYLTTVWERRNFSQNPTYGE